MIDQHAQVYLEEASELLTDLESTLLEMEENPSDLELVCRAFRALHTIKGSGSMFGFEEVASFTHDVETVFDLVRSSRLPVTSRLISLSLEARDHIRKLLFEPETSDREALSDEAQHITWAFREMIPTALQPQGQSEPRKIAEIKKMVPDIKVYRIHFAPDTEFFLFGANPVLLLDELQKLGPCTIVAHRESIPALDQYDPEKCYCSWDIILSSDASQEIIREVFMFVEDSCELRVEQICEEQDISEDFTYKRLGEILVEKGTLSREALIAALSSQKKVGELLIESGVVSSDHIDAAVAEQEHVNQLKEKKKEGESVNSIKVASDKLDRLVDLVGELVTVQANLSQTALRKSDPVLVSIAEEVERLTGELRDQTMGIRMLPIGSTFSRFKRLVRDLSKELGKEVELQTEGAETELDKTVIDRLGDPLVHLIRNSIDHGIETPNIRKTAGKNPAGIIQLSAIHSGGNVLIRIMDDGAGMDREVIRKKGVEKGLISSDASLTESEIFSLIFASGFSTAEKVTNVSGRGVGMDVVRRTIDLLRGSIDVQSEKGKGTTITLKLPLTLAIIDGLLVRISEGCFVLPLSTVEECIELTNEDVKNAHGKKLVNVRGEIVPYISLRERFAVDGGRPDLEQIVVVNLDGERIGFVVDDVIGEHETVIKSLGRFYRDVEGVSGATILGDGTVALILDVSKLASER